MIAYQEKLMLLPSVESVMDCLILSQLIYWAKKMNGKEFFKKDDELANEIGIPLSSFKKRKIRLKHCAFLSMRTEGCPPVTYYLILLDKIKIYLDKSLKSQNSTQMVQLNGPSRNNQKDLDGSIDSSQMDRLYIEHKTTPEITTENNPQSSASPSSSLSDPPQLTESEFVLFRKAYPKDLADLTKTRKAFFEFLPQELKKEGLTFERFLKMVGFYAADVRSRRRQWKESFDENLVFEAHNFISKRHWLNPTWLDKIASMEAVNAPRGTLDEEFHRLAKDAVTAGEYEKYFKSLHLLALGDEPQWEASTTALTIFEREIEEILEQLKGGPTHELPV